MDQQGKHELLLELAQSLSDSQATEVVETYERNLDVDEVEGFLLAQIRREIDGANKENKA